MANITHADGQIDIATAQAFTMQGIWETIQKAYPNTSTQRVVGISIPSLGIECNQFGTINPIEDLKEAAAKMFFSAATAIVRAVYNIFKSLAEILGMGWLDEKLPVLDLSINDLFSNNIWDTVTKLVTRMYFAAKDELKKVLNFLGIPFPLYDQIADPKKEIAYLVKTIITSLWSAVQKRIKQGMDLIKQGLAIWDARNSGTTQFSITWQKAIDAILSKVLEILLDPFDLYLLDQRIKEFAARVLGIPKATYGQIMHLIDEFRWPGLGKLFDWILPINPKVFAPNFDYAKLLSDMKMFVINLLGKLLQEFCNAVKPILDVFGISIEWPTLNIPIRLCVINLEKT